jgi:hypothetical protein
VLEVCVFVSFGGIVPLDEGSPCSGLYKQGIMWVLVLLDTIFVMGQLSNLEGGNKKGNEKLESYAYVEL